MKCNLYLDKGIDKAIVVPTNYNEKVVIENIGDNYKKVGMVEIPCYEEQDSYYLYTFGDLYTEKLILHLKNKKFYESARIHTTYYADFGVLKCIDTMESFQYEFKVLCDEYSTCSSVRIFKKLTQQEGEDFIATVEMMRKSFENLSR